VLQLNQYNDIKNLTASSQWISYRQALAAYHIVPIINNLGPNVTGIEIGVCHGVNSYMLLECCSNISTLVGVDHYKAYKDWDREILQHEQDHSYATLQHNMAVLGPRFKHIKASSKDAAHELQDNAYDFVFIDADHSMRSVLEDLDNYWPKIKDNGIVAGHDANLFSVNFAVTSWAKRKGIDQKSIHMMENQAWYFVKHM
jgi:predicted O-methyltransferase YrrM